MSLLYAVFPGLKESIRAALGGYAGIIERLTDIIAAYLIARIVIWAGCRVIKRLSLFLDARHKHFDQKRVRTMRTVLASIWRYLVYFLFIAYTVNRLGLATGTSLIATAGIGGIIIGIGGQSLIKDIITGFFILFEDEYAVGDYVNIDDITGTVVSVQLRITQLKTYTGEICTVPNGSVGKVINYTRGDGLAIVDMPIAHIADAQRAKHVLLEAASDAVKGRETVIEPPQVIGLVSADQYGVFVRTICRCKPMEQFQLERDLRTAQHEALRTADIPMPRTIISGRETGEGNAGA